MENLDFSEKNISDEQHGGSNEKIDSRKTTEIIFDPGQLDFIKFRLTFNDGFNFGLGIIVAWIAISLITFLFLSITGVSFSALFLRGLI